MPARLTAPPPHLVPLFHRYDAILNPIRHNRAFDSQVGYARRVHTNWGI